MRHRSTARTAVAASVIAALFAAAPLAAQADGAGSAPRSSDVATIDGVIAALYESISGPAGARDWDRFYSLMLPGAFLAPSQPRPDTLPPMRPWTAREYAERVTPFFMENPFYEVEAARRVERFGTVAHVWSTYESRRDPAEEPFQRGINSIQLVRHADRWWVASIVWDSERPGNVIPARYLESRDPGRI